MTGGQKMGEVMGQRSLPLENTPTWVVAAVCSLIVFISFILERTLHILGKYLKKKEQITLFEALLKIKEELMLLGFISLLLTVFKGPISSVCIPHHLTRRMLPCETQDDRAAATTVHFRSFPRKIIFSGRKRLLAEVFDEYSYCSQKGKVPLLSIEALDQLHIFIFFLAVVHVLFCLLTMLLGGARIRQWKLWEESIAKDYDRDKALNSNITQIHQHAFIQEHFWDIGKYSAILIWIYSFFKQFYASVTKLDYITLRRGFIMRHSSENPKYNFHSYTVRALEADFKKVVGIRWYLWVFVVIFLLFNVDGWHTYFWIAFIPLALLLAVGTKLEHIIIQLAQKVAEKRIDLVVHPSDDHFWFNRPKIVLYLIHFILFQNAFEIAFFFWILTTHGFTSCIIGQARFVIPRLVTGMIVQLLCSYSTLPLYAIVTQMGSSFKKAIFRKKVRGRLVVWARKVKRRRETRNSPVLSNRHNESSTHVGSSISCSPMGIISEGGSSLVEFSTFSPVGISCDDARSSRDDAAASSNVPSVGIQQVRQSPRGGEEGIHVVSPSSISSLP